MYAHGDGAFQGHFACIKNVCCARLKKNNPDRHFRMATARSSSAVAFRRTQYALKRSVDRLTKRVKSLSSQLKTAREKLSSISDEALCDKQRDLDIPEAQATAIKECISPAKRTNKKNRLYT